MLLMVVLLPLDCLILFFHLSRVYEVIVPKRMNSRLAQVATSHRDSGDMSRQGAILKLRRSFVIDLVLCLTYACSIQVV